MSVLLFVRRENGVKVKRRFSAMRASMGQHLKYVECIKHWQRPWWLVECENAVAGRHIIAHAQDYERVAPGPAGVRVTGHGFDYIGRILASGGTAATPEGK